MKLIQKRLILFLFLSITIWACSDDDDNDSAAPTPDASFNIWSGPKITFTKVDGAIATEEANQDRITENVWITRGSAGQIFNIKTETEADQNTSPADTEWAIGTTSNITNLTFQPFRDAVGSPKDVVDKDLVLHLITDDIYIDVKFTSWASGKEGGFAYERSTE